jgi:hypothetical protein
VEPVLGAPTLDVTLDAPSLEVTPVESIGALQVVSVDELGYADVDDDSFDLIG